MPTKQFRCHHCWIEVEELPKPNVVVGRGEPQKRWKHKSTRNEVGVQFCGRTILYREDLERVTPVSE